jgi:hypothetical protein
MGCQEHPRQVFREPVVKHKRGPVVVSERIIANPVDKKPVQLRKDLKGLSPEKNIDHSIQYRIAKFYERDIPTYKVEPEIKKSKGKPFSISPDEEDAPLQIFLKPVQ